MSTTLYKLCDECGGTGQGRAERYCKTCKLMRVVEIELTEEQAKRLGFKPTATPLEKVYDTRSSGTGV